MKQNLHSVFDFKPNVKIKFSLEIRIFSKCSLALGHHNAALNLKRITRLSYSTPHDPTTHDPTMHDSSINYPNQFKLCRKNYKHHATRAIFCLAKDRELLLHVNVSPHHVEFSEIFLKKRTKMNRTKGVKPMKQIFMQWIF